MGFISKIFSSAKNYLVVALSAITGILFFWLKLKNREIEQLEEEVELAHREKVIDNMVEVAETQAEALEDEELKNINENDWRKHI